MTQKIKQISFIFLLLAMLLPILSFAAKDDTGTAYLEKTSQAFTQIAKKATPAAVFIKSEIAVEQSMGGGFFGQAPGSGQTNPFDLFNDEFFRRFFGSPPSQHQQPAHPQVSGGSGFLVTADGYILTNYHVVKDAEKITAVLNDGREYDATVKGMDPRTDLAVLKIEGEELPYLTFGNSDYLDIGEWVIAIGNPFALEASLTVGVVSAKGRQDLGITTLEDFIQTDAAINPGNSGGPLLNLKGEVIGINTAIVTRSGGYMGIGFAIPSNLAKHAMDQIIETGIVKRAYLGIVLQPIDKKLAEAMSYPKLNEGVLISEVVNNSPASKAGLKHGDIILMLNGTPVKNVTKFRNEIALMDPGTSVHLQILRGDQEISLHAILETLSDDEISSAETFQKLGLDIENLDAIPADALSKLGYSSDMEGVFITKIKPNSPAAFAGLRPNVLITGIVLNWRNQKPVKNIAEFKEALQEIGNKKYLVLIVRHQSFQKYYTIKIGD